MGLVVLLVVGCDGFFFIFDITRFVVWWLCGFGMVGVGFGWVLFVVGFGWLGLFVCGEIVCLGYLWVIGCYVWVVWVCVMGGFDDMMKLVVAITCCWFCMVVVVLGCFGLGCGVWWV